MCIDEMMSLDGHGGTGHAGAMNIIPAEGRQASAIGSMPFHVAQICTVADSIQQFGPDDIVLLTPPPALSGSGKQL